VVPVEDPALQERLREVLEVNLADDTNAWTLGADGCWNRAEDTAAVSAQRRLHELATSRSRPGKDVDATSATRRISGS
jgi:polyphosphate kinase